MMIHKILSSEDNNYWLKRLDKQLNDSTNQNPIKVPKVFNFGDKFNKQSIVPFLPDIKLNIVSVRKKEEICY